MGAVLTLVIAGPPRHSTGPDRDSVQPGRPIEASSAMFLVPQDRGHYHSERLDVTYPGRCHVAESDHPHRLRQPPHGLGRITISVSRPDSYRPGEGDLHGPTIDRRRRALAARAAGLSTQRAWRASGLGAPTAASTTMAAVRQGRRHRRRQGEPGKYRRAGARAHARRRPIGRRARLFVPVYIDIKDRGVAVDDVVLLPMANYGLKLYGSAIVVNSKFAATEPESVNAFLRAFQRGLREAIRNPSAAVDSVPSAWTARARTSSWSGCAWSCTTTS